MIKEDNLLPPLLGATQIQKLLFKTGILNFAPLDCMYLKEIIENDTICIEVHFDRDAEAHNKKIITAEGKNAVNICQDVYYELSGEGIIIEEYSFSSYFSKDYSHPQDLTVQQLSAVIYSEKSQKKFTVSSSGKKTYIRLLVDCLLDIFNREHALA